MQAMAGRRRSATPAIGELRRRLAVRPTPSRREGNGAPDDDAAARGEAPGLARVMALQRRCAALARATRPAQSPITNDQPFPQALRRNWVFSTRPLIFSELPS